VALWIGNDEGLYYLAMDCLKTQKTVANAARRFSRECGMSRTPDGANMNITCIQEALAGLKE
jgi:hypothetical protein